MSQLLWNHQTDRPPIGRGSVSRRVDGLGAAVTFDSGDEFARQIEAKYRSGMLHAVSVSWDFVDADGRTILDWHRLGPERMRDECWYDLAEISAVSVPGDPRALVERQMNARRLDRVPDVVDDVVRAVLVGHLARPALCPALGVPGGSAPVQDRVPRAWGW